MRSKKKKILIADDEKNMIWALKKGLQNENFEIITASNGEEAYLSFIENAPNLVLLDQKMPKLNGIEVLKRIRKINRKVPIIMITAHGSTQSAVEAMKLGALDYISKPFDIEELKLTIEKALEYKSLNDKVEYLSQALKEKDNKIIYKSTKMKNVLDMVCKVAPTKATVLILGESGTGKELIANMIHENSDRRDGPFIKINCGALPENLLESELFGYEKGAFTGAISKKPGKFDRADDGSIFLDEIGEISQAMQIKLLRVLQEGEFERIGGTKTIKVNTRIIAATNKNLREMVDKNLFREDLYYRLNVIPIEIPPLRERKEDIGPLVDYFIKKYSSQMGLQNLSIDKETLTAFKNYEWRGNVRELQNIIERCVILSPNGLVNKDILPDEIRGYKNENIAPFEFPEEGISLEGVEKSLILKALEKSDYNQSKAARLLNISRYTLIYRMEKYDIK